MDSKFSYDKYLKSYSVFKKKHLFFTTADKSEWFFTNWFSLVLLCLKTVLFFSIHCNYSNTCRGKILKNNFTYLFIVKEMIKLLMLEKKSMFDDKKHSLFFFFFLIFFLLKKTKKQWCNSRKYFVLTNIVRFQLNFLLEYTVMIYSSFESIKNSKYSKSYSNNKCQIFKKFVQSQ